MRVLVAIVVLAVGLWWGGAAPGQAAVADLAEWAVNIDGAVADSLVPDPVPPQVNTAGFNLTTGLGTLTVTVNGAGAHYVGLFVDHEIDQVLNGFSNEQSAAVGAPSAGLSFETDEPELNPPATPLGNIFTHFNNSALDNTILAGPEDMSMALAWNFILGLGETAVVTFLVSEQAPLAGFYLQQSDPAGGALYFSAGLDIQGGPPAVPEPASLALLAAGLAGLAGMGLRARPSRRP